MTTTPTLDDLQDEATWLEWRARAEAVPALRITDMVTTEDTRREFLTGARILRLDKLVRAGDGGTGPSPIQLVVADVLNAGHKINAILEPRRTTKTTSCQAVLLGRCALRPNYQAAWTMLTTGQSAGQRFREDIADGIPYLDGDLAGSMKVNVGKGTEHIYWPETGSRMRVLTPKGASFRGGGFDAIFADEGGEADPDMSDDIMQGALPTMDTKIGAQFIVAGTPAKFRTGNILWEQLNNPRAGVLWHGIPETVAPEHLADWEPTPEHPAARMRELIELAHPGVGYTTPIEAIGEHFEAFPREKFLREYGGLFGIEGAADRIIPAGQWQRARTSEPFPDLPDRFAAAFKVHHLGHAASLAIAWEYEEPADLVTEALELDGITERPKRRAVALWWHQHGTTNVDREVLQRIRRTRATLWYDKRGYTEDIVEKRVATASPRPTVKPTRPGDIPLSTVAMLRALEDGTLVVFDHPELERAAQVATRRAFGLHGTFAFGAPKSDPEADVTPLEAAALALHFLDQAPQKLDPTTAVEFA
ncbi:hypothetical protein [Microbacterium sp. GXF7504]